MGLTASILRMTGAAVFSFFHHIPPNVAPVAGGPVVVSEVSHGKSPRSLGEVTHDLLLVLVAGARETLEEVDDLHRRSIVCSRRHQRVSPDGKLHLIQVRGGGTGRVFG